MNAGSPGSRCYARARLSAPSPDGPGARRGIPKMSSMLDHLLIHQTSIAILLLPRVKTLAIWGR
jgi:hypothetical protein